MEQSKMDIPKEAPNMPSTQHQGEDTNILCLIIKDPFDFFIRYDIISNFVHGIRSFLLEVPSICYFTNYELVVEKNGKKLEDYENIFELGLCDYDIIKMNPCLYNSLAADFHLSRLTYILNEHAPFFNKNGQYSTEIISKNVNQLIEASKAYFSTVNELKQRLIGGMMKEEKEKVSEKKEEKIEEHEEKTTNPPESQNTPLTTDTPSSNVNENENENPTVTITSEPQTDTNTNTNTNTNINPTTSSTTQNTSENTAPTLSQFEECLKNISETKEKIMESNFLKFSFKNFSESVLYESSCKPKKFTCLNSIFKSIHNQIVKESQLQGDLMYLEISTLEGNVIHITACEKGFYINNSRIEKQTNITIFDPSPCHNSCYSYTLPGLLCQASAMFKERFTQLISQVLSVEVMLYLPSASDRYDWLYTPESQEGVSVSYNYRFNNFQYEMDNLRHIRLNKEWNEEFQAFIDINFTQEPIQNITKEKLLTDFYKLFKETAMEGVKLIREKRITPFTFFDNPRANSGYYMYGNIFFTVLDDTYMDFRTFTKDDQKQTYLGSNLDLRHINYLNANRYLLDLKDFYFSLNCIVQYKGLRAHAQVITPGVIFNSENLVEYGEGEEGVIKYNQDFHEAYSKFCQKLNIRSIICTDKAGKDFEIVGNPEIKGVRGVDKRKYLFDLIHLFPRDLNFSNDMDGEFKGCLLRPELLKEYQLKLIYAKMNSDYQDEMKKINSEINPENLANLMKDHGAYLQFIEEKYKKKEELYDKIYSDIKGLITYDTTIGTSMKSLKFTNPYLQKDTEFLQELAGFLKNDMIHKLLTDIAKEVETETTPSDCKTLTDYIHKYGISCRYYGEIYRIISSNTIYQTTCSWLKTLIVRDILRRCAKHIFNELIIDIPEYLAKENAAYLLNIFLAPPKFIKNLDAIELIYENGAVTQLDTTRIDDKNKEKEKEQREATKATVITDTKKKKKSKAKKKKAVKPSDITTGSETDIKTFINETLNSKALNCLLEADQEKLQKHFLKPSKFWEKMKAIAKARYNFILCEKNDGAFDYVDPAINKIGLLRDFCLTVGLQIEAADYELYYDTSSLSSTYSRHGGQSKEFKYINMPFKPLQIHGFHPIVKDYLLPSELHRPIYDQAEALSKAGHFTESADKLKQLIYLCNEIYGPINFYSAMAHKKLGELTFLDQDYLNGILSLQKAIAIFEKMYDYDTSHVANAYSELSTYYHLIGQDYLAFKYISRGLEILNFTYPKNHPELINRICNMAMYYVDLDMIENAKDLVESSIKICSSYFEEDDKNLQIGWLLLSQLSLKSYNITRAIFSYEKYLGVLKKHLTDENIIQTGEKILEGLKTVADEIKKKHNLMKSKEDSRKIYDEHCRKGINILFWDDLEKPTNMYVIDPTDNVVFNYILKKGYQKHPSS